MTIGLEEKMDKISKRIKKIKTSQQSQHDIIKEVLLDIIEVIEAELKNRVKATNRPNNLEQFTMINKEK